MAQSVHTEPLAPSLIMELIQVGIIGAVLVRHTRAEIDENKVLHIEALFLLLIFPLVRILQNGVRFGGVLTGILRGIDLFQDFVCPARQRNDAVARHCLWRPGYPKLLLVAELHRFPNGQCAPLPVNIFPCQSDHLARPQPRFQLGIVSPSP